MRTRKVAPIPLETVLRELCRERGLGLAEVVNRAGQWCDTSSAYRVMSGSTKDPRTATLAAICRALDVRPQEVFERAGLWEAGGGRREAGGHAELRRVWTQVACLPDGERVRVTQVVRAMVEAAQAHRTAEMR